MKKYILVEGPTTSQFISKKGNNADAVNSFQAIVDQYTSQGWSYHSMEPITTVQTKGCLFNKQTITTTFYMLVFVQE